MHRPFNVMAIACCGSLAQVTCKAGGKAYWNLAFHDPVYLSLLSNLALLALLPLALRSAGRTEQKTRQHPQHKATPQFGTTMAFAIGKVVWWLFTAVQKQCLISPLLIF
ncbi:hypothetical protein GGS20DRAFT_229477 [Poronia punctata]|nr:hypothetical protein GGS20DRAFT_229477 [Poronia punctata]